jgi:hypothetical protein
MKTNGLRYFYAGKSASLKFLGPAFATRAYVPFEGEPDLAIAANAETLEPAIIPNAIKRCALD